MNDKIDLSKYKGKRIASFDFGLKRIGYATSDELHITVAPKKVFDTDSINLYRDIASTLLHDNVGYLVVGLPIRLDNYETELMIKIREFAEKVKDISNLEYFFQDESYSTISATQIQIASGTKKKKRSQKGAKDLIAAAIILKDFINEQS
ncbi:MAG: Holliday junction resolvase RuvX [Candidatus Kapabacteria bacterium]|nr:Holliday junction resolvase RuvX [Candidatus Kapabacteria bacterium]